MTKVAYVVGDVHGCMDALARLEERIHAHAAKRGFDPLVVLCGDLVDRGPDAAGVVRHARRGVEAGTHVAVLGNHEVMMLLVIDAFAPEALEGAPVPRGLMRHADAHAAQKNSYARSLSLSQYLLFQRFLWIGQGGAETLRSYGADPADELTWRGLPRDELRFLASRPVLWEDERCVVTHALVGAEDLEVLRRAERHLPAEVEKPLWTALGSRKDPPSRPDPRRVHVSGHTPLDRVRRLSRKGLVQIDTGCVYGRTLTAFCTEGGEVLRVSAESAAPLAARRPRPGRP